MEYIYIYIYNQQQTILYVRRLYSSFNFRYLCRGSSFDIVREQPQPYACLLCSATSRQNSQKRALSISCCDTYTHTQIDERETDAKILCFNTALVFATAYFRDLITLYFTKYKQRKINTSILRFSTKFVCHKLYFGFYHLATLVTNRNC